MGKEFVVFNAIETRGTIASPVSFVALPENKVPFVDPTVFETTRKLQSIRAELAKMILDKSE